MTTTTEEAAADLSLLAVAYDRGERVAKGLGDLRELLEDVQRLVALAERGVLDRALIQQHAGFRERAERVRGLHDSFAMAGGLLVCRHCSSEFRLVQFPCPTLVALDG